MLEYKYEEKKLYNYLGDELYNILKRYNVIIAGGTITSLFTNHEINDIDIYFRSKTELSNFLLEEMQGSWIIAKTDKAFLFKYNKIEIQAIYFKYFESPSDIFDTFDFTVCMGSFDFKTESFVLHEDFLKHNSQRILKFNQNTAYPIVSALRIDKYKKKGYYISKPEFIRVMLTILNCNITDYKTLKEQMGGMYGENYDALLQPIDGEEFDLIKIIDRMKDLSVSDQYFKQSEYLNEIENWEEYVLEILGEKIRCFKYKEVYYKVVSGSIKICKDYNDEKYDIVNVKDIISFPLTRYKYVRQDLTSYWDKKYLYKVGEYNYTNNKKGLFAAYKDTLNKCSYNSEKDNILLELRIDSIEDVCDISGLLNDSTGYNKVFVTRIVSKEEEKIIRKSIKEENEETFDLGCW